jgi:hypothetical protein
MHASLSMFVSMPLLKDRVAMDGIAVGIEFLRGQQTRR